MKHEFVSKYHTLCMGIYIYTVYMRIYIAISCKVVTKLKETTISKTGEI